MRAGIARAQLSCVTDGLLRRSSVISPSSSSLRLYASGSRLAWTRAQTPHPPILCILRRATTAASPIAGIEARPVHHTEGFRSRTRMMMGYTIRPAHGSTHGVRFNTRECVCGAGDMFWYVTLAAASWDARIRSMDKVRRPRAHVGRVICYCCRCSD